MKKQNHTSHIALHTSQKGITLIALIITIIVMLILVGVAINVTLNGGLFQKAETATYQTEASLVKEQLEIAKAIELANAEGKEIEDYSYIKVENLESLDQETKTKFKDIILVNANGEVCYNPEKVTAEQKTGLEAIGIKAYVNNPGGENNEPGGNQPSGNEPTGYSFTLNQLGEVKEVDEKEGWIIFDASNVWQVIGKDLSQENNYFIVDSGMQIYSLESNNKLFCDLILYRMGKIEIEEDTGIIISASFLEGDGENYFCIVAKNREIQSILGEEEGKMTAEEFMNTYGNEEFRLVEIPK